MFSLRQLDPETKNYVCEDQFFNDAARQIGYASYARKIDEPQLEAQSYKTSACTF